MKALPVSFSHINLIPNPKTKTGKDWTKPYSLDEILKSSPKKIERYTDLMKDVAHLLHHNRQFTLFFRGQSKDHLDKDGKTTILPGIFRRKPGETKLFLKERFEQLEAYVDQLR